MDTAKNYEMKINRMYRDRNNEALWNGQNLIQYTGDEKMKAVKSYLSSKMAELGQRKQGAADKETFEAGKSIQNLMDMMKVMGFIVMSLEPNSDSNDFDDAKKTLRAYDSKNFTADFNRVLYYFGEDMIFDTQMQELGELATQMDNLVASTRRGEVEVFIENAGDVFQSIKAREEQRKKDAAEIARKLEEAGEIMSSPDLLDAAIRIHDDSYQRAVEEASNAREQLRQMQKELKNNEILSEEEFGKYTEEELTNFAKYPDVWKEYTKEIEDETRMLEEKEAEMKAFPALEAEMQVMEKMEEAVKEKAEDVDHYAESIKNHEAEQAEYDRLSAELEDYKKEYPDEATKIEQQKKKIDYAAQIGEVFNEYVKYNKNNIETFRNTILNSVRNPRFAGSLREKSLLCKSQKLLRNEGGPEGEALANRIIDFFTNENSADNFPAILSELKKTAERAQENISKNAADLRQMENRRAELKMYLLSPEEIQKRKQNLKQMKTELEADRTALEERKNQFTERIDNYFPYSEGNSEVLDKIVSFKLEQTPGKLEALKNEVKTFHDDEINANKKSLDQARMEYEKVRSKLPEKVDGNLAKQANLIHSYQNAEKKATEKRNRLEKVRDIKTLYEGFTKKMEASLLADAEDLKRAKILQEPQSRMQNTLLDQLQSARGRLISKDNDSKEYKAMTSALDNAIRVMGGKDKNGKPIPAENMAEAMKAAMENVKQNAEAYQTAKQNQWFHFSWLASGQRVNRLAATENLLNICSNADIMLNRMPKKELTIEKIREKTAKLENSVGKFQKDVRKEAKGMVEKAIEEREAEKNRNMEQTLEAPQKPAVKKDAMKI